MYVLGIFLDIIFSLQNHADPRIRNSRQESPLDLAAQYGRMEAVSKKHLRRKLIETLLWVRWLIDSGLNWHVQVF